MNLEEAIKTGYIILYRCLLNKPIWKLSTPEQKTILVTLLLMVNHAEKEWEWQGQKYIVKPGQMVTSLESITKACGKGISVQNVRTALLRFEKLQFLTNESTKTGRLITVTNWDTYQIELRESNKETNNQLTNDQQTGNKDLTTNNNDNNDKNDKKNIYAPEFENFWTIYPNKKDKAKAYRCWNTRTKEGHAPDDMIQAATNYAKECKGKETRFIKHGSTFLGPDKPFLEYLSKPKTEVETQEYDAVAEIQRIMNGG
jgi:hypothetical protein